MWLTLESVWHASNHFYYVHVSGCCILIFFFFWFLFISCGVFFVLIVKTVKLFFRVLFPRLYFYGQKKWYFNDDHHSMYDMYYEWYLSFQTMEYSFIISFPLFFSCNFFDDSFFVVSNVPNHLRCVTYVIIEFLFVCQETSNS